jgi:serine/threonine protein kinase
VSLRERIHTSGEFIPLAFPSDLSGSARRDLPDGLLDEFARDPERYFDPRSGGLIKNGRKTQLARATLRSAQGVELDVVIKKFRHGFPRRLAFFFAPSPALRSLAAALLLERKGLHTPAPLAALDGRGIRRIGTSYYIAEDLSGALTLRELWRTVFLKSPSRPQLARAIVDDLARLLYRLHADGIYHRDLKGGNILVRNWLSQERCFFIVDLDRVEACRLSSRRRIKNLLQVRSRDWSARERIRFFLRYGEFCGMSRSERQTLTRSLLRVRLKDRSFLNLKAPF